MDQNGVKSGPVVMKLVAGICECFALSGGQGTL